MEHIIISKKQKVNQYTLEGIYIKTFDSITDAAFEVNGISINISKACVGQGLTSSGFICKYLDDSDERFNYENK